MRKPTILRTLIFVLAMLFNFASYSQNGIAYNSKFPKNLNENIFLKANNQLENPFSLDTKEDKNTKLAAPITENPVIKYAQGQYAGVVSECPNDGKKLPKLFLCGSNDSRLIETGITDAISIQWERRTGGCTPNINGNCANDADNCTWADVATGPNYNANAAGEFRLTIRYTGNNVVVFYFNVYKNEVDPTGITKSDIVKDGGTCTIPGQIRAGGFGNGFEYSFTTNPAPNAWQDSDTFPVTVAGSYNVFMRLKNVNGSCIYNVKNIVVSTINFSSTVTVVQPACSSKGSIKVKANTVNNQYNFYLFKSPSTVAIVKAEHKLLPDYEFTGLDAGTYTVTTTIDGTCATDTPPAVTINVVSSVQNFSSLTTPLSPCASGTITGLGAYGTAPYRYFVNIDNAGFVDVPNGKVIVSKGGTYIIRVEDVNGCSLDKTIVVAGVNKPVASVVTTTSGVCNPTGTITVNITNSSSYNTIQYSKDFGANWQNSNTWTNQPSGEYNVGIRYRVGNSGSYCVDDFTTINIGAVTPLTASAGVAALPGCRPGDNLGIVRITNPQGGKPGYTYKFNNTDGYQASSEGYFPAGGPYTVSIKDQAGCIYDMTGIYMDDKPSPPSIVRGPLVYNCDGTGSQTVIVNGGAGDPRYTFQYYLDGYPNPNTAQPNVFLNIPAGDHWITVDYNVVSVKTPSNLLDESFGSGENTTSPGINTFYYCFERQIASQPATWCNGSYAINDGDYSVTSSINQTATSGWNWRYPIDHTKNGVDPKGRFLAVNIGDQIPVTTILYEKQINDVIPNQPINFEFYAMNLMMPGAGKADANLRIALVDASGTEISWFATGSIARSTSNSDWKKFPQTPITLDPGPNTSLRLIIRSNVRDQNGNDVAIDDIKVYQVPKVCGAQFKERVTITPPPPFTPHIEKLTAESCPGVGDGSFEIYGENFTGEFYYSINNGTWIRSTVDRVKIGPLAAATYSVKVRRDKNSAGCDFDIPTTISSPPVFKLDATSTVATCNTRSVVEAIIQGGTGPVYTIVLTNKVTGLKSTFILEADGKYRVRDVEPGTYTVSGVDNKTCPASKTTDLGVVGSVGPSLDIAKSSKLCFNETVGATIDVTIKDGLGPFRYRVKYNTDAYGPYSAPFSTRTFSHNVTVAGTYSFEVLDANSCSAEHISQQIDPKLVAKTAVNSGITCKTTGSEAIIQVTIEGGTAPYTYVVKNSLGTVLPGGTTTTNTIFQYSTGIADTYTFDITDFNNCPISISQKVDALVRPTAKETTHDPKCFGEKGSVDITPLTGKAPFLYQFNGTGPFTANTTYANLSGSAAGIEYSYTIRDDNECERTYKFKIYEPTALSGGTATISPVYNCDHPATITVTGVTGGTGAYQYTLLRNNIVVSGPQTLAKFEPLSIAGDYTVTVTDANSCSRTLIAGTISPLNPPTAMTIGDSGATCPNNQATVTITDVKNAAGTLITGVLEYRIVSPTATPFSIVNTFTNLNAGTVYTFEVRDANNCTYSKPYTILAPASFTVASKSTPEVCFNAKDGTATFTVTGIATGVNYTYKVDTQAIQSGTSAGSPFDIKISGLGSGNHSITVTNLTTNCPVTKSVVVGGATALLALDPPNLTDVTCKVKGTAKINAKGGVGTYTYTVTQKTPVVGTPIVQANNNLFNNLVAGTYSVSVTDSNGCNVVGTDFTINTTAGPSAYITLNYCTDPATRLRDITVSPVTAPQPNYEYSLNSGGVYQDSGIFTGLDTSGSNFVTVRDKITGCTQVLNVAAVPTRAELSFNGTYLPITCDPTKTSPILVKISGGNPDFTYKVNQTGAPFTGPSTSVVGDPSGITSFTYQATASGYYYFQVTDSKGCVTEGRTDLQVPLAPKPTFTTNLVHVNCNGGSTGSITVKPSPALGNYQYVLTPVTPTGSVVTQTTALFSGLKAGEYSIVITNLDTKCVSDPQTVIINDGPLFEASATVTTPLTCGAGNAAQAATITVIIDKPGTPYAGPDKYRYSYNGQTPVTSNTFSTTTSGPVSVVVYDANNCSYTIPVDVDVKALNPPSNMTFDTPAAITCETGHDKTNLTVRVTNGVSPFQFEITSTDAAIAPANPVATGITTQYHTFINLAPGQYFFKVTDVNKCTTTGDLTIKNFTPVLASGAVDTNVSCKGLSDGVIKFTVSEDITTGFTTSLVGSVSGTISGGSIATNIVTYSGLKGGETYTFTVTNNTTKCFGKADVTLADPIAITAFTAKATNIYCNHPTTTITVSASAGTTTLYYAVVKSTDPVPVFPAGYQTSGTFNKDTSVDGISYTAYVINKDGNCRQSLPVSIVTETTPTINPITTPQCYSGTKFTVTITGSVYGGTPLYGLNGSYDTNPVKTITGPGTYTLGIKDDHGCEAKTTIDVNDLLTIEAKLTKDLTCPTTPPTATAAQITLSATGGDGTYTYEYKLETTGTYTPVPAPGTVFNPTTAGNYYFKVSSDGCSAESSVPVEVTVPVSPVITSVTEVQSIKCNGDETAAINIVIDNTKGVAPFVYHIQRTGPTVKDYGTQTSGLAAGDYTITVTDGKGCPATQTITIGQPNKIAFKLDKVNIQCTGGTYTLGSVLVQNVSGGTAPFTYFITNNFGNTFPDSPHVEPSGDDYTFDNLINFGIYTVTVVDGNGCQHSESIAITSPPQDLIVDIDTSAPNCSSGTAVVTVKASPLGSNYTFAILETNVPPFSSNFLAPDTPGGDKRTFTGLTPGVTYTFVVHDGDTGCDFVNTASIPIPGTSTLTPTVTPKNVSCKNAKDGSVSFTISGYNAAATSISYQIFGGQSNLPVTGVLTYTIGDPLPVRYPALPAVGNMLPGLYYITFTENGGPNNGCKKASDLFYIKESSVELSVKASVFKNENCNTLGVITAEAKDGTGPYFYLASTSATTPLPTDPAWQNSGTFNLAAGTYYIFAKDSYECIKVVPTSINLVKDPDPVFDLLVADKCAGEGKFIVDITVTDATPTMAPYSVSVNGGDFINFNGLTYAAKGLNSGLQTIIIQNKNGCPVTQTININATPIAEADVTKPLDCSVTGSAVADANIRVKITKGTADFEYAYKKDTDAYTSFAPVGAGQTILNFPVASASAGTYIFQIKDANDCITETSPVVIDPIVPIVATVKPIQPLCNGGNGTIELSAVGGKGVYTYTLTRTLPLPAATVTSTTGLFTGLAAGSFTYTIKDVLGCEVTGPAVLGEPSELLLDLPNVTQPKCGTANVAELAKIILSATGGTGDYTYSFNNSAPTSENTYTFGGSGTIPYYITDANGCSKAGTVTINKLDPPTKFNIAHLPIITCQFPKTTVTISNVENGAGPIAPGALTYQIISPASAAINNMSNPVFTDLLPGDYVFQVTDANSCTKQLPYTINDVVKIDIIKQGTTDITCVGNNDGTASFLVTGFGTGVGTYNYELDANGVHVTGPADGKINLTGLTPGNHTIIVEDDETKCSEPFTFRIETPLLPLSIGKTVTPRGCETLGAVTISADGGWDSNYVFTLTDPDGFVFPSNSTGVFDNLSKIGVYTFTVKDAKGCTSSPGTFELFDPINPVASIDVSTVYCYRGVGAGATIVVNATTPGTPQYTPVYEYSINNGATWQGNTFTDLGPGDYQVTVRDQFGCKATASILVSINGQLFASAAKDKEIFCAPAADVDGKIIIKAVGGYSPYSYTVTKDGILDPTVFSFPTATATSADYMVTGKGKYIFNVTDSKSCPSTTTVIEMVDPTPVVFTATPVAPSCTNSQGEMADGQILVELAATNNNGDYKYTILRTAPTAGVLVTQDTGLFTGLVAGTYTVNVISARGCEAPIPVVITEPIAVTAGYDLDKFECTPTNVIKETTVTLHGFGGKGGNVDANYRYSEDGNVWYPSNQFTVSDTKAIQNLTYYVKDLNNCTTSVAVVVNPFPTLDSATANLLVGADCPNSGNETIKMDIVGGTGTFEYQVAVDGGSYSTPATAITTGATFNYQAPAGHYYQFKITDVNTLCTVLTDVHNVPLYNTMKVVATSTLVSCKGLSDGTITINIENYTGDYKYDVLIGGVSVANGQANATANNPFTITGLPAGEDYEVEINQQDYPSCIVRSNKISIKEPDALNIDNMVVTVVNQNCKNTGATITIDPTGVIGGTKDYKFAILALGDPVSDADYKKDVFSKTVTTSAIAPLSDTWIVYVKDAKDCPLSKAVNVSLDPMPAITDVAVDTQCATTSGYNIEVTATGVLPLKYSLDGVQFQDDNIFKVYAAGDYTVTVMDKNQCTVTAAVSKTILAPLTLRAEIKPPVCNNPDGIVKLFASGGTVTPANSYVYTKDNWANSQVDPEFKDLPPGDYVFIVKDVVTNCVKTLDVKIPAPKEILSITATTRPVTCQGYSNGGISITLADTSDPLYKYSVVGGVINIIDQDSPEFNNLPVGDYSVTVKSGSGCDFTQNLVHVGEPDLIEVTASHTEFGCTTGNTTNNAVITVNKVVGGSGKYEVYEYRKGTDLLYTGDLSSYTVTDHSGGTYTVTVYDSNNCQGINTAPIVIKPFATLTDVTFDVTAITCAHGETIQAKVAYTGTLTAPLQYTLTGTDDTVIVPQINNSGLFKDLEVGDYLVTVLNTATNCTIAQNHKVIDPNTFAFVVNAIRTDICFGESTGSVELTLIDKRPIPNDEAGPFTYTITGPVSSSGSTTDKVLLLTGLKAGRYDVLAKLINSPECEVRTSFDIAQPSTPLKITVAHTRITCESIDNDNGTIDVFAEGGWPGTYQYELVGPVSYAYSEVGYFEKLTPGHYIVNAKDSNECIVSDVVDLVIPDPISFTATATSTLLTCYGDDSGVITVSNTKGGQESNYVYSLTYTAPSGDVIVVGPQEDNVFTGLKAGTYTVSVADGFSCETISPTTITLTNPTKIEPTLSLKDGITCLQDATLTLLVIGGTAPYTYSEDGVNYGPSFNGSVSFPVSIGLHRYFVKDNLGCVSTISNDINIEPVTPLAIELDIRNAKVNCTGEYTAVIVATATGGLGNYQYSLLNGAGTEIRPAQPDGVFDNLNAVDGPYTVHVKSGDCTKNSAVTPVTEPLTALTSSYEVVPVKCFGDNNGKIVVTASGGTGSIKYAISPYLNQFVESGTFDRLEAGTYTVIVQDVLGCNSVYVIDVKEPAVLIASEIPNTMLPEICKGDKDGAFSIQIKGGVAPYFESLDNDKGPYLPVTGLIKDYVNQVGGKHNVYIKDSNGCISQVEIRMPEPVVLDPTFEINYDCVNNAQSNMVIVTVDKSNIDLTQVDYSLDSDVGPWQSSNIFTDVAPGTHYIVARHTNGCKVPTTSFSIKAYEPLTLALTGGQQEMNVISVTAAGGAPAYEYSFNGEPFTSSNKYKIYKSGDYVVVVRDKNGCTATITVPAIYIDVCLDNYFTPAGATNTSWGPGCTNIYDKLEFSIFDRYGRVIAKYHYGQKWDGRYNGAELPSGDYWYVLKLNDPKDDREFVGHFTLYR